MIIGPLNRQPIPHIRQYFGSMLLMDGAYVDGEHPMGRPFGCIRRSIRANAKASDDSSNLHL